jgi:hypothetical protein
MGWGTGNLGGGSGGLNFKIKAYETKEALLSTAAANNTIGIITTEKITSWVVDHTAPVAPSEGMVWIGSGSASRVVINILKRNALYIYPQVARQYVSGVWVNRDSYCYQNKSWTPLWFGQLYTPGDEWSAVTGGWTSVAKKSFSSSSASAKAPTITRNEASIVAETTGAGVFHAVNKINLTEFDTLTFRGEFKRGGSSGRNLMAACWKDFGTYYDDGSGAPAASTGLSSTKGTELTVDISKLTGEHIIGLGLTDSKATVTEVILSASDLAAKAAAYDILMEGVTT